MTKAFIINHLASEGTILPRPYCASIETLLAWVEDRAALQAKYDRMIALS